MFNISSFLEKFSKNVSSNELYKKQILEIIEKNTQLTLLPKELEIKNYVLYVNSSPGVKNKVFMSKDKILEDINISILVKIHGIR